MARSAAGPPLKFKRQERKKWTDTLSTDVIEMIEAYPEFHAETTGEPAPSQGEVVDEVVRKVLGGHSDFKKFLEKRRTAAQAAGGGSKGTK